MKLLVTAIIVIVAGLSLTSCHRYKYYSCLCSGKQSEYEVYRMGRLQKDEAYTTCRSYQHPDSISCNVEIRN